MKDTLFLQNGSSLSFEEKAKETLEGEYDEANKILVFKPDSEKSPEGNLHPVKDDHDYLELGILHIALGRLVSAPKSQSAIIENALKIICDKLQAQTAAIFLVAEDGVLRRAGIYGKNWDSQPLTNDWFPDEHYMVDEVDEPGESFTGKAVRPTKDSVYGSFQYKPNLHAEALKSDYKEKYCSELGDLKCAIAIPLNDDDKTYGVLRVFNKIASENPLIISSEPFSFDDVRLLLFLAPYVTNKLSNLRKRILHVDSALERYIAGLLIQPNNNGKTVREIYQSVLDPLVKGNEIALKAVILRVEKDKTFYVSQESEDKTHENVIIGSEEWITHNNLYSRDFPLIMEGETVGSLSLYTNDQYEFNDDFFKVLANLLALLVVKMNKKLEDELSIPNKPDEEEAYIERQAKLFDLMKDKLLSEHKDKYVLFEDNNVLDFGDSRAEVAMRAYKKHGMKTLFIEKVSPKPEMFGTVWTPFKSLR